jgi:8-oxo-dGTP diphosphatase
MTMKCACLVSHKDSSLLLVRVRDNLHWYLPGGKIEPNESPEEALHRELFEELQIDLLPESIQYLYTINGPAYNQSGDVELICFSAKWHGDITPCAEISAVEWLSTQELEKFAPAVQILCKKYFSKPPVSL